MGANRRSDSGDGLSSINPDDIVSMNILKGAAASALYGSRAKDGVIMITTRNRNEGEGIKVEYNLNYQSDTPYDLTITSTNTVRVKEEYALTPRAQLPEYGALESLWEELKFYTTD